jgi:large subunit ribosomal protein L1
MPKHGKKYREVAKKIDRNQQYDPTDAISLAKEVSFANFDETVELHIRLGVDPRHADQQVRDVVVLPHGLGKTVRVLVFAQGEDATLAREAGADYIADDDEMIKKIQDGWTDFDVAIATPTMMGKVGRLGRILGPRSLMPSPKAGTVVPGGDLASAISQSKAGRVEFRVDKTANIHVAVGKISFDHEKLYDNVATIILAVKKARPAAAKGAYMNRITLSTTMGPGIRIDVNKAQAMEVN